MTKFRDYRFTSRYYYGLVLPENLVVNASLQKFAQRVSYICSLHTSGKISSKEASKEIRELHRMIDHIIRER